MSLVKEETETPVPDVDACCSLMVSMPTVIGGERVFKSLQCKKRTYSFHKRYFKRKLKNYEIRIQFNNYRFRLWNSNSTI